MSNPKLKQAVDKLKQRIKEDCYNSYSMEIHYTAVNHILDLIDDELRPFVSQDP